MQLTLANGKVITLNDQQEAALLDILDWIRSPDEYFYTLKGYAGTGKSTIVKKALEYMSWGVVVSAPTHKAKNIISKSTGKKAHTIQSILGLQPNLLLDNFDINNPKFSTIGKARIKDINYLIIDEGSMFNADLFNLMIQMAYENRCKVLFMGDPAQLPPVNEEQSLIFISDEINRVSELTKVERQADSNPLMLVYDKIREDVESPVDKFDHITRFNEKTKEGIIFIKDKSDFEKHLLLEINDADLQDPDSVKILAWTNDKVKEWNKFVRRTIYQTNTPDNLMIGEALMSYSTIGYGANVIIENSADYIVVDYKEWEDTIEEGDVVEIISKYQTMLKPTDPNMGSNVIVNIIVPSEANYSKFIKIHNAYLEHAKSAPKGYKRKEAWRKYYVFKENNLLLHDITKGGKLLVKKDLDYAYAITVHKSQGSTYNVVFIDENDINKNRVHKERNNLKYVALSRPILRAYVLSHYANTSSSELNESPNNDGINTPIVINTNKLDNVDEFKKELDIILKKYKKKKLNLFK